MLRKLVAAGVLTAAVTIGVAPVANALPPPNCSSTSRCDIPQGDPDYASRLNRDGDGVACEC